VIRCLFGGKVPGAVIFLESSYTLASLRSAKILSVCLFALGSDTLDKLIAADGVVELVGLMFGGSGLSIVSAREEGLSARERGQ
jgi:hypothetical protein